ncbi:MAG: site-specific integrase [Rhodospirillales bacterium]|nr:site-specific integrase [Rhodospirillales bacterium]
MGIYLRGKTYWVRFEVDGQEIRQSARTASRIKAEAYLKELKEESGRIKRGGRERHTYRQAMERFLIEYLPTLKPGAATRYASSGRMLHEHFQGLYLDQITAKVVKAYVNLRKKAGQSRTLKDGTVNWRPIKAPTIKRDLACLMSLLTRAVEWDMIDHNPLRGIDDIGLHENEGRVRYLSPDEYAKLLGASSKTLQAMIKVLVATGLRKEELLSLKWSQVDLVRKQIVLTVTKSGKPRVVPLSDEAAAQLSAQPRHIKLPWVWHHDGARYVDIRSGFYGACRRAGIEDFNVHDLRHTFASWAVQGLHSWQSEPMDIYRLSKWLGHSTTRMTERYAHLDVSDLHRAVVREPAQKAAQTHRTAKKKTATIG